MKLGSLTISTAVVLGVVAGAALWLSWCHDPSVRAEALLTVAGDTTDVQVAREKADQREREAAWHRTESVIRQQSDVFRHRADSLARALASRVIVVAGDSLIPKPAVDSLLAAKDSLIAHTERLAAFYQGQVASYRDTLVPALRVSIGELTAQRNAWEKRSQRRIVCGPGVGVVVSLNGQTLGGATAGCTLRL